MRAVLIGAPGKSYDVSIRYRYRGKHSSRQTLTVTAPADLEATNAAAFDGQGALATQNDVAWATQITSRPTELTDGRVSAGLDASGDLNRNITTGRRNSSDLLGRTGGGDFSGELNADLTSAHTAAAIASQGALATLSAATWASHVSGRPTELTDGRVSAGLDASGDLNRNITTGRRNSSDLLGRTGGGDFSGELNADLTSAHTAAAIASQGALATLDTVAAAQLVAGVGKNCVIDGDFRQGTTYWTHAAQSGSTTPVALSASDVPYFRVTGSGVTVGHVILFAGSSVQAATFQIVPGDRVEASVYIGASNVGAVEVQIDWLDSAGAYLSGTSLSSVVPSSTGAGDLSSYQRLGGFGTAPASAKQARVVVYAQATTSAPVLRVSRPLIARANAAQTELTPWNMGFEAVPGADITSANTAAAITSQGALATLSAATWASHVSGRPTELTDGRVSAALASTGRVNGAWRASNPLITGASAYRTPINPLSSSDAGATATISIAAHTLKTSDTGATQKTASYNSGSITGLAFGTSYHIFAYDPTFAGGAVTYVSSTSSETYVTNAEYIYVGYITTVNDGGGGGGGFDPPPEDCVCVDAWLTPSLQAREASGGDVIDCLDGESFAAFAIDSATTALAPCVRLTSASGVALTCSRSTPITQPGGDVVLAPAALGALVAVDDAAGFRWERIIEVTAAGDRFVRRIHIGGRTYAAGDTPGRRMFTHNPIKP